MEKGRNLKKMANFFKFFLCILGKLLKTDYSLLFLSYFPPGVLRANPCHVLISNMWAVLSHMHQVKFTQ